MWRSFSFACLCWTAAAAVWGTPYTPRDDAQVLADLPPGTAHVAGPALQLTRTRLDVALPLAQFYITRARATGDLRFLGYAEANLTPWLTHPQALVLHATVLQSRHSFEAALQELDLALRTQPDNAQAWLTKATILRVLGRYPQSLAACAHLAKLADPAVASLCSESVRGLTGQLESAYATLSTLPVQSVSSEARAWLYSELGEMAERLGRDSEAERWFTEGLKLASDDFYTRAAYADLLLRQGRQAEVLSLLAGHESMEPLLLRIALARRQEHTSALLANAFLVEEQRGDAVHRREQARFLLDIQRQPQQALLAAAENWRVQHEPDDVLIFLRAAQAAGRANAAAPALDFVRAQKLEDVRLKPYL